MQPQDYSIEEHILMLEARIARLEYYTNPERLSLFVN